MLGPMALHVAVVHRLYVGPILAGTKTVEARLQRARVAPFGRVRVGERVFFKTPGGPFVATARVERVEEHEHLTPERIAGLRDRLGGAVGAPAEFWLARSSARFATFLWLIGVEEVDAGPDIRDARDAQPRAAWLVLPEPEIPHGPPLRSQRSASVQHPA